MSKMEKGVGGQEKCTAQVNISQRVTGAGFDPGTKTCQLDHGHLGFHRLGQIAWNEPKAAPQEIDRCPTCRTIRGMARNGYCSNTWHLEEPKCYPQIDHLAWISQALELVQLYRNGYAPHDVADGLLEKYRQWDVPEKYRLSEIAKVQR